MCGVYPKTFKFVGWHPFCRCIAVPKLADEDEFIARQQALIDGENPAQGSYDGEITEMPQCFTNWVQENAERIETAKSQPYFIADNRAAVRELLHPKNLTQQYDKWILKEADEAILHKKLKLYGVSHQDYNNSPIAGLRLVEMNDEVREIYKAAGIEINHTAFKLSQNAATMDWGGNGCIMSRLLYKDTAGNLIVEHSLFHLAKNAQNKGLTRSYSNPCTVTIKA